ncbi:MAG: spondin domain-containing protein [Pseudomonadota bacterium]
MEELRITVRNLSPDGGTFLTPVYFGFHDGSFDLFDAGQAASPGLEQLAEDGAPTILATERVAADADSQGLVVAGAGGPIATRETTSSTIEVDGMSNGSVSLAAMILPSNDAFIGTDEAVVLFDANGQFLGAQTLLFEGSDVYDAGTEVNTELDAAFINQVAPNTGVDENGVVTLHPGFNGSAGNPVGEGDQIILGGVNDFGAAIDPVAADFTLPGAQIAQIHINTVATITGDASNEVLAGSRSDDIVSAAGGNDIIVGRAGWDVIDAGDGRDAVFGGAGADDISGGLGRDFLRGGAGDDIFRYAEGDGVDFIFGFGRNALTTNDGDVLVLSVDGVESFADVLDVASSRGASTLLNFGNGDAIVLRGTDLADLTADDFIFG